jgi:hypothetical protein
MTSGIRHGCPFCLFFFFENPFCLFWSAFFRATGASIPRMQRTVSRIASRNFRWAGPLCARSFRKCICDLRFCSDSFQVFIGLKKMVRLAVVAFPKKSLDMKDSSGPKLHLKFVSPMGHHGKVGPFTSGRWAWIFLSTHSPRGWWRITLPVSTGTAQPPCDWHDTARRWHYIDGLCHADTGS